MQTLRMTLQEDIKNAMRAKDQQTLGILRFISAAIKQREVDERIELSDAQVLEVLTKMTKQRRESIEQFRAAGRNDLADKEALELEIIERYLPQALTMAELEKIIVDAIQQTGATTIKDMAKVMMVVKPLTMARADMSQVSLMIKERLAEA